MLTPHQDRSPTRVRLRFPCQRKHAHLQLSIKSLFALTSLTAVLVYILKWLYPSHLPLMPMLTLIPPLIAIFLLHCATRNEIWKGVLVGGVAGICLALYPSHYKAYLFWRSDSLMGINAIRLTIELGQIWIFFQVAAFPLVGGCIEAIRKRYVSLGIYALSAAFVYYFSLILGFIWVVSRDYWK